MLPIPSAPFPPFLLPILSILFPVVSGMLALAASSVSCSDPHIWQPKLPGRAADLYFEDWKPETRAGATFFPPAVSSLQPLASAVRGLL